jgi:dTDP-4-amino-4,6-dideoxygalactose transaminase
MESYQRLEKEWAEWNGLDPDGMVVCNSGTAALHLAMEVVPEAYEEVLIPDYTMISCPRAATAAMRMVTLVDCGMGLLMNPSACGLMEDTPNLVVMPVHIYGRRAEIGRIRESFYHAPIMVEDLAEAHGVKPDPETEIACWSFYRNKIVAGEEGGAVWLRHPQWAEHARSLRSVGFTPEHNYVHIPRGMNYRLANSLADQILKSLGQVDRNLGIRRQLESLYDAYCPLDYRMPPRDVPWVYDLRIPGMDKEGQDRLVGGLREKGHRARHGFRPMHMQEEFQSCMRIGGDNAERLATEIIYLPLDPGLEEQDIARMFHLIRTIRGEPV